MVGLGERRKRGDAIQVWKILSQYDYVDEKHWSERYSKNSTLDTRLASNILNLKHKSFNSEGENTLLVLELPNFGMKSLTMLDLPKL